jgi:hypothetical protein
LSIVNVPPSEGRSQNNVFHRFLGNAFVQVVLVLVALAVAFSGKLDSQGSFVTILAAWLLGSVGIYTHVSGTAAGKKATGVLIVMYGLALWGFYKYLTTKPPQIVATNPAPQTKTESQATKAGPKPQPSLSVNAPKKEKTTVGKTLEGKTAETQTPTQTPQLNQQLTEAPAPPTSANTRPVGDCFSPLQDQDIVWGEPFQVSEPHMGLSRGRHLAIQPEGAQGLHLLRLSGVEIDYSGPPDENPDIRPDGLCWDGSGCTAYFITFKDSAPETLQLKVYSNSDAPSIGCIDKIQTTAH